MKLGGNWMDLEKIIVSEGTQTQKDYWFMFSPSRASEVRTLE